MVFEGFKPTFSQVNVDCPDMKATPFLFYVYALNPNTLRIIVTDFHNSTWESIRTVQHLEDMRDSTGIGGSWSEFLDYFIASLQSEYVKLVIEGQSKLDGAKLIAQKSKGLPRICVSLKRLDGAVAADAIASFSLELFKAFNCSNQLLMKEQERCSQLTKEIAAEQEKNGNMQRQMDRMSYSDKQKSQKITNDKDASSSLQDSPGKQSNKNIGSTKLPKRAVPAFRRARVRGALLQETEDDADN